MGAINYIIRVFASDYNKELKSKAGFKSIAKKVMLFLLTVAATQAYAIMSIPLPKAIFILHRCLTIFLRLYFMMTERIKINS